MRRVTYADTSPFRLSDAELAYLLKVYGEEMFEAPLFVDDGYRVDLFSSRDTGYRMWVGRAGLYEQMAVERLTGGEHSRSLRGLFYPGATPSWSTLYQAALYFDEIFLVHPGSPLLGNRNRRRPYGDRDPVAAGAYQNSLHRFIERLEAFDREIVPLKQAGVLRAVPPQGQDDPNFLRLITADLADTEFRRIAEASTASPVFVAARKMEPLLPLIGATGDDPDVIRAELEYRTRSGRHVDTLFKPNHYGVKEVHPTLAATILLNHAFLLSDRHGLIPFTDDERSLRLMQCKLRRIKEMFGFDDFKRELALGTASLAMRVLDEQLPRFEFRNVADVLEARDKLKDQLRDFREAMRAFAGEIDESPYDAKFQQKIERVVATKVQPAITALDREIRTSRDSFVARFMRNVKTGSVPIVASVFVGLPAAVIVGLSAGVLTVEAAIETYLEVRNKKRHGLTLFLKP
jgi:hypothetical protein